jgi:hypothetical protein
VRRLKTECTLVGSGSTVLLAAQRLSGLGIECIVVNPSDTFSISEFRPHNGLGLWSAAYRGFSEEGTSSLSDMYSLMQQRLRECYPAPIDEARLVRSECWSILSSTPVHQRRSKDIEREFFRVEKKPWSAGHFRLVNPDHVSARLLPLHLRLQDVADVEGAVVRANAIWWDAAQMSMTLAQMASDRLKSVCFRKAHRLRQIGKQILFTTAEGEELSVENERGVVYFLSGQSLPYVKDIASACHEPWIQGVRKKRREMHVVYFENPSESSRSEPVLLELGDVTYRWDGRSGVAAWSVRRGPDGLDRIVDEGLRMYKNGLSQLRFNYSVREFFLDWEWKGAAWKKTEHDTYWATGYEGDLFKAMELLWNFPLR